MAESNDVLFEYVSRGNPKSNEDLKRFLRRFPEQREEIIDFTATWRAMSILETTLPAPTPDPSVERQMLKRARVRWRAFAPSPREGSRALIKPVRCRQPIIPEAMRSPCVR